MPTRLWSLQYNGGSPSKLYSANLVHPQSSTQRRPARTTCRTHNSFCGLPGLAILDTALQELGACAHSVGARPTSRVDCGLWAQVLR